MSAPYRDASMTCPSCGGALRSDDELHGETHRLLCDACSSTLFDAVDFVGVLRAAIRQWSTDEPVLAFRDERPGKRVCPRCQLPFVECKVVVTVGEHTAKPRTRIDRCKAHGLWIADEDLVGVIDRVVKAVGRKPPPAPAPTRRRWFG